MSEKQVFSVILEKDPDSDACGICVPFDVKALFGTKARVPVRGTINGFAYRSSIMPMGGRFLMAVNKALREGAKVKAGDLVAVVMERDEAPREVAVPADLKGALAADPAAKGAWEKASYTHRKETVLAIEEAKKPETRARRVAKALEELRAKGKK